MTLIGHGGEAETLSDERAGGIIAEGVDRIAPDGKSVLVIVPDHTRTCPLPMIARRLHAEIAPRADRLDFMIALGTHPPLDDRQIDRLLGIAPGRRSDVLGRSNVFNHVYDDPAWLKKIGTIGADRIAQITDGKFAMDIDVTVNKRIFDYDVILTAGPVFPHEVVGFSGGAKYFFPGISGGELLNFFHWLGAVMTNPKIIGTRDTPVRATLHAAFKMIPVTTYALCMVVRGEQLAGLYFGTTPEAWFAAANLSEKIHIIYVEEPFDSVLSCAPPMYDELWVGGKCMYKLEPVVADGGELIIYAPHITGFSRVHGKAIEKIGFHTRDYFLAQWDRFKDVPWGILAHSTHVCGIGTYEDGVERPRIRVTLATGIEEETCRRVNLGYRDPASIDPADWQGRQDQGRLCVPKAGEMLYKLKHPPQWQRFGV